MASQKITELTAHTSPAGTDLLVVVSDPSGTPVTQKMEMRHLLANAWPVGSLYLSTDATNPGTLLGFGTWEAYGAGRVLVGVDGNDADFDTAGETGGAKTVTLTTNELPSHSHSVTDPGHAHVQNTNSATTGSLVGWPARDTSTNSPTATGYSTQSATTGITIGDAGSGNAFSVMNPYIAVFFWRRTA